MARKETNVTFVKLPDRLGWLITFSDMVTLLLTFFVMIIAMSSMDSKALKDAFGFFSSVAGPLQYPREHQVRVTEPMVKMTQEVIELKRQELTRTLVLAMKELGRDVPAEGEEAEVQVTGRGLSIRVSGDVLFHEGSSRVRKDAEPVLRAIAGTIRDVDATIAVEGHTDNVGSRRANWYLSLQRANGVADFFVYGLGMGMERFCVAGYGQKRPVATNDTATGREKNRRVEIILLKDRI
jgi:chemotaxis protein MotB